MQKLYLILLISLTGFVLHAQPYETNPDFNRTRNWHFGHGVGLRFDPDTIYEVPTSIHTDEAAAVHTDADGNLLLYSNGEKIWNANHEVIHNGNLALGHHSSSMGSVFVVHEDNPNHIYLFNTNYSLTSKELTFNLIVREADTFRIVYKDSVLRIAMSEPIAVVKADIGKDIWIVTHVFNGSSFVAYRLTQDGLTPCPVISSSKSFAGGGFQGAQFDIVFSVDGKYLLKSNQSPIVNRRDVSIYSFNSNSGELSNLFAFDGMQYPITGIGFSKNNENLFIIERDSFLNIYAFDPLDSLSTIHSKKQIAIQGFKFELQNLTYSNDIALLINDSSHLALITNPDNYDSIKLSIRGVPLGTGRGFNGLPNFNRSFFYTPSINFTDKTPFRRIVIVGLLLNKAQRLLLLILKPP